jgi:predicted DNA binding protein
MASHRLSKSTYIRSLQCQKSLYLHVKRPFLRDKISAEQLAKFRRGTDVGVLARDLYPGGYNMSPKSPSNFALKRNETLTMLQQSHVKVLYEAVFEFDEVLIMLDILVRDGQGWKAIEVKSSKKLSNTYCMDAALQYYVLKGNGLKINSFGLMHINENYVFDGKLQLNELFTFVEVLPELERLLQSTAQGIAKAKATLKLSKSPDISVGKHCFIPYTCDFLGHCWKNIPSANLLQLRSLSHETASKFFELGRYTIHDIRTEPEFENIHSAEVQAFEKKTLTTSAEGSQKIGMLNQAISRPLFVKILSMQPALPTIPGTRPYQHQPIAISWDNGSKNSQSYELNADGTMQARATLSELVEKHDLVITDDTQPLIAILHPELSNSQEKHTSTQCVGIRQLIETLPLFHPEFGLDISFEKISKALTNKSLTSEHWLMQDLIASNELAQTKKILGKLEEYTDALKLVWAKITAIGTEN